MKKLLISVMLFLSFTLPAGAQRAYRFAKLPLLDDSVTRAVVKATAPWQEQLAAMQKQFEYVKTRADLSNHLPPVTSGVLSYLQEQTYLSRLFLLQKSMRQNGTFHGYTFVAPSAQDLAQLSYDNYAALSAFLAQTPNARVTRSEYIRPFTLAVQIHGIPQGTVEVWIDVPTKKVYLMSNNFYTTAAGKYGLHLK